MNPLTVKNREIALRFDRWLKLQRYSPITRDMYGRAVREYIKFLGDRFVTKSTHLDVQEFLAEQASKGIKPRTVLYKLYSVRVFFDFLSLGGLVKWCPPRFVKMRRVPRTLPKVLTVEDLRRLFSAAKTPHERALLEVLYGTGCRTDEVRTMLIEDIDFARRRIRVRGKVGTRYVMFAKRVGNALRRYLAKRRDGYVFIEVKPLQTFRPSASSALQRSWRCRWKRYDAEGRVIGIRDDYVKVGKRMSYQEAWVYFAKLAARDLAQRPVGVRPLCHASIQKAIKRIGFRAGVDANPRHFRHTFATHLLDNGADLRDVQELMGHTSIRSTELYTHVSRERVERAFDKFHPDSNFKAVVRKSGSR